MPQAEPEEHVEVRLKRVQNFGLAHGIAWPLDRAPHTTDRETMAFQNVPKNGGFLLQSRAEGDADLLDVHAFGELGELFHPRPLARRVAVDGRGDLAHSLDEGIAFAQVFGRGECALDLIFGRSIGDFA